MADGGLARAVRSGGVAFNGPVADCIGKYTALVYDQSLCSRAYVGWSLNLKANNAYGHDGMSPVGEVKTALAVPMRFAAVVCCSIDGSAILGHAGITNVPCSLNSRRNAAIRLIMDGCGIQMIMSS